MKKLTLFIICLTLVFGLAGCRDNTPENKVIQMSAEEINKEVTNWVVYTNPAYRYELRFPKRWEHYLPKTLGDEVTIYPDGEVLSDEYHGAVYIKGTVNWQTEYTLPEYFEKVADKDLYAEGYEIEEFEHAGFPAVWFKNVTSLYEGQTVDVIAFDLKDRIIEFRILDEWDTSCTIFNSMYFYGTKAISVE